MVNCRAFNLVDIISVLLEIDESIIVKYESAKDIGLLEEKEQSQTFNKQRPNPPFHSV